MKEKRVEFAPPKDYAPPENAEPGKEFDVVCSFVAKPSGELCMTKFGDHDMPGYDDKDYHDKQEEKPTYGAYAKELASSMDQQS